MRLTLPIFAPLLLFQPASCATSGSQLGGSNPTPAQRQTRFHDSANRAVERVHDNDYDDNAILLSLLENLRVDPALAPLRDKWEQRLDDSIARADRLRRIRVVLLKLKRAFAHAEPNPGTSFYRKIDIVSCRQAFAALFERYTDEALLEVTVPPIGRKPLTEFNELCEASHSAELQTIVFPKNLGTKKLRQAVKRAVERVYPAESIKRLSVSQTSWTVSKANKRRELRATIGLQRDIVFPEEPCVMREIQLWQEIQGRTFGPTECCEVTSETPIRCDRL